MMYMLLGHITEVLGKDFWEKLVTSRIYEPIGMPSTKVFYTSADVFEENTAMPYIMPGDKLEEGNFNIYRYIARVIRQLVKFILQMLRLQTFVYTEKRKCGALIESF